MEERQGTILDHSSDKASGHLTDMVTGATKEFINPVRLNIKVTDKLVYISVIVNPPSGPVREINILKEIIIAA